MKGLYKFLSVLIVAMLVVGCGPTGSSDDKVVLGVNFDLSGAGGMYGQQELEGVKLAVKQFNEKGGYNGKEVEILHQDNTTNPQEAARLQTVLAESGVFAIIGATTSGTSTTAIQASKELEVPTVSPSATSDLVTNDGSKGYAYGYRVSFSDSSQGSVIANFAEESKFNNIYIFSDNSSDYGKGLSSTFKSSFDGTIVGEDFFKEGDEDFNVFWNKIKGMSNVDAVFIPGYATELALIIKQARDNGVNLPILGADGLSDLDGIVATAGPSAVSNIFFSNHYSAMIEDEYNKAFVEAFEKEYGKKPETFSALAYDATNLVLDALVRADSTDPKLVNEQIAKTIDFKGVTGVISIDELHNAYKSIYIIELSNGVEVKATEVKP